MHVCYHCWIVCHNKEFGIGRYILYGVSAIFIWTFILGKQGIFVAFDSFIINLVFSSNTGDGYWRERINVGKNSRTHDSADGLFALLPLLGIILHALEKQCSRKTFR